MLVIGGVIGLVVSFLIVAIPTAHFMASQVGLTLILPPFLDPSILQSLTSISIITATIIHIILALVGYLFVAISIASNVPNQGQVPVSTPPATWWEYFERFGRGWLIGVNSAVTLIVLPYAVAWLSFLLLPLTPALFASAILAQPILQIAGVIVAIINLLALSEELCNNRWFCAVLGWTTWLSPPAWPATFLGLLFIFISYVFAFLFGWSFNVTPEWWTCSFVAHGGPHVQRTFYNLGNVLFAHPDIERRVPSTYLYEGEILVDGRTVDGYIFHETGHTLNVGAFGAWFNYIGFVHQQFLGGGFKAYPELLAEGHLRTSRRPWFLLWATPIGLVGTLASNTPPTTGTATVDGLTRTQIDPLTGNINLINIVPAGSELSLQVTTIGIDPDSYPLAAINPGTSPNVGELWEFTVGKDDGIVADPNNSSTTAKVSSGGDYELIYAVTDGIELPGGIISASSLNPNLNVVILSNIFWIRVVEAVANVPPNGSFGEDIPIDAKDSTAGSAAAVPSRATGGIPLLNILWTTDPPDLVVANPNAEETTIRSNASTPTEYKVTLRVTTSGVSHEVTRCIALS